MINNIHKICFDSAQHDIDPLSGLYIDHVTLSGVEGRQPAINNPNFNFSIENRQMTII